MISDKTTGMFRNTRLQTFFFNLKLIFGEIYIIFITLIRISVYY